MNFDATPATGPGVWPRFCTNTVTLHIKSKVMKSKILWCKNFALEACLGITRGQKVGFWVLFFFFFFWDGHTTTAGLGGSVGCVSNCRPEGRGFNTPHLLRLAAFYRGELIMKYFLRSFSRSLPLIQEGQLSVSGERMCTVLVNRLRGLSLPSKSVVR